MGPYQNSDNQWKEKRQIKKTILFYCEGKHDTSFVKHLKSLYHRSQLTSISVRSGRGGPADGIVVDASKKGTYDKKIVVLDTDGGQKEMNKARQEAKTRNIELIEQTPCLECVLLTILSDTSGLKKSTSRCTRCKKKFYRKYIPSRKMKESNEYKKFFPKKLLNTKRKDIKELDRVISIMETGE